MFKYDILAPLTHGRIDSLTVKGDPVLFGDLSPGETVLDVGCGIELWQAAGYRVATGAASKGDSA